MMVRNDIMVVASSSLPVGCDEDHLSKASGLNLLLLELWYNGLSYVPQYPNYVHVTKWYDEDDSQGLVRLS